MNLEGDLPMVRVQVVEQLALHAWPALAGESMDGWWVRYAAGVTRRANSVWPNVWHDTMNVDELLSRVENFYHARGQPARYQICPAMLPKDLDDRLAQRGYRATARTAVQTATLEAILAQADAEEPWQVEIMPQPSAAWWTCYAAAEGVAADSIAGRQAICAQIKGATAYASLQCDGKTIAVGSAVAEKGWVGFFNIATLPAYRRKGAARALMIAIARWGQSQGATLGYLQVMARNEAALRLYCRFGLSTGYFYHYREEAPA